MRIRSVRVLAESPWLSLLEFQQRAIDVESRKKAIGGKSEAKRRLECLHFEIGPATLRSHVSIERLWPLHESVLKRIHVARVG